MRALQYRRSIPRYLVARLLARRFPGLVVNLAATFRMAETPEPKLPGPEWVRVRPLLSGICGSDTAVLTAESTPYLSPLISFPFVPGHEIVGEVVDGGPAAAEFAAGQRVVVEPALGCKVRGLKEPCGPCLSGMHAACERVLEGDISAGIQTGFCRDTGGGWGPLLAAHKSQLYRVPDSLSNEAAVLTEPLSCAVHGVLRASLRAQSRVLVIGCGTIGLLTIAALRAFAPTCTIVAMARYPHQRQLAQDLGATHVVAAGRTGYQQLAGLTGGKLLKLPWGKPHVLGGVEASFVCSGSAGAWEDALRWTRARGPVVMVAMPAEPRVDLTPLWYKELNVYGSYAYGQEQRSPNSPVTATTFQLALDMMAAQGWGERLAPLVRHRFPIRQYRRAFLTATQVGRHGSVKTVFDLTARA